MKTLINVVLGTFMFWGAVTGFRDGSSAWLVALWLFVGIANAVEVGVRNVSRDAR